MKTWNRIRFSARLLLGITGMIVAIGTPFELPSAHAGASVVTTISGKAKFERRSLIGPLKAEEAGIGTLCVPEKGCPTNSSVFWVMTIEQNGISYEWSQSMALGDLIAPESVEVAGIVVRPGTYLAIEALVESMSEGFGVITDIHSVNVLMD